MAGDRARVSHDPSRKWRGLTAQQGRVTVEADWNEAATIAEERDRQLTLDVVGPLGTPDLGYAVTATSGPTGSTPGDLTIGPGTLYVGGERLDLDGPVDYAAQPDWLDYSSDPLWLDPAVPGTLYELVYLLAAEQEVSAVEDPALADVALGGPDTMQRQRILQHFVRQPTPSGTSGGSWSEAVGTLASMGLQFDPATMRAQSAAALQVSFTTPTIAPGPCQPAVTGGYLGAENQMIRVMVAEADTSGVPVIVWGFDDASFLYRLLAATYDSVSGNTTLTLASAPVDSYHYPAAGQAVEVLRDAAQLTATQPVQLDGTDYIASAAGYVSSLTQAYDPTQMQLVVAGQLPPGYLSGTTPQLYLRVWQATVLAPPGQPVPLVAVTQTGTGADTGVAVTLSSSTGTFHAGDFWRFALRPIEPAVVYPARYLTAPQPPEGPRTWACPLALLTWTNQSASVSTLVPPFSDLVELTAAEGGCCTVDVGPDDVGQGASLQSFIDAHASSEPITVCLKPGTYTLPAPLVLGPELDGITVQACREGVVLQAREGAGDEFVLGLIAIQGTSSVTIRGLELFIPLAGFTPSPSSLSALNLPQANETLLTAVSSGLQVAMGIFADDCTGLAVEDCTFDFPDPGEANLFGAGIFATGAMDGVKITGCTVQSASPPAAVPFNELAVTGYQPGVPYQLTFGYLQVPDASVPAEVQVLHDATIEQDLFQGVTVPVLVMADIGTMRMDRNTVRNAYGGFWLVSLDNPAQILIFDQLSVGDPAIYAEFAGAGIAALRDGIFVIATAIGQLLPTSPPLGSPPVPASVHAPSRDQLTLARATVSNLLGITAAPAPAAAVAVADTGISVSLRLDVSDCQVDAVIADSYSGAGLLVVDLTADAGSALVHGNRIRTRFPMGEAVLVGGVGEASVTGNIMANEVAAQAGSGSPPLASYSMVLDPVAVATPFSTLLDPSGTPLGAIAVVVTGNVFIDQTLLPARPATSGTALPPWNVLNTVIPYGGALPSIAGLSLAGGPGSGGTPVTVTGSGFTGATEVDFGPGNPGTGLQVTQDGSLTVTSPAGAGTVDVTVTTPFGTSATVAAGLFTYLGVTSLNPTTGPPAGGTFVQVSGSGFTGASEVSFGPNPGTNLLVAQDGLLSVTSPAGSGTVHVTVKTPLGVSPNVIADQFSYTKTTKEGKDKEKDTKETKETKDTKETKEKEKDRKDTKEGKEAEGKGVAELEKVTEIRQESVQSLSQLTGRIEALDQQAAAGQAFITPAERPEVGTSVLQDDEQEEQ